MRRLVVLGLRTVVYSAAPPDGHAARGQCVAGAKTEARCHVWTAKVRAVNDGDTIDGSSMSNRQPSI